MKINKNKIRYILPKSIYKMLAQLKNIPVRIKENKIIEEQPMKYKKYIKDLRLKAKQEEAIKIAFFVEYSSIWKCEELYELFKKDNKFEPIIVVVPVVTFGHKGMVEEMEKTYNYFKSKKYKVIKTYNNDTKKYLDVKKKINPDIIIYTRPYKGTVDKRYYISNYLDRLSCYINYSYQVSSYEKIKFKEFLPNIVWKFFIETELHYDSFYKFSRNKAKNAIVTGYPGVDQLVYDKRINSQEWKIKADEIKRIIWAPHYTIDDDTILTYSNFLTYYNIMLELAEKYKNQIQIVFKPHPALKQKLYEHKDWGIERTDKYYDTWKNRENTFVNTDAYIDLFNSSDALIHDSGSFTAEYLHCGKPALFTMKKGIENQFNDFGKKALAHHYYAYNSNEVEEFIVDVIIGENDYMKEKRNFFYYNVLRLDEKKTGSENIYTFLQNEIFNY